MDPYRALLFRLLIPYLSEKDILTLRWVCVDSRKVVSSSLEQCCWLWRMFHGCQGDIHCQVVREVSVGCDFVDNGGMFSPIDKFRSCCPNYNNSEKEGEGEVVFYVNEQSYAYDPPQANTYGVGTVFDKNYFFVLSSHDHWIVCSGWCDPHYKSLLLLKKKSSSSETTEVVAKIEDFPDFSQCYGNNAWCSVVWSLSGTCFYLRSVDRVVQVSVPELRVTTLVHAMDTTKGYIGDPMVFRRNGTLHGKKEQEECVVYLQQSYSDDSDMVVLLVSSSGCDVQRIHVQLDGYRALSCCCNPNDGTIYIFGGKKKDFSDPSQYCLMELNLNNNKEEDVISFQCDLLWSPKDHLCRPGMICDALCVVMMWQHDVVLFNTKTKHEIHITKQKQKQHQQDDDHVDFMLGRNSDCVLFCQLHRPATGRGLYLYSERIRYFMPERIHVCKVERISPTEDEFFMLAAARKLKKSLLGLVQKKK